jgi:hypothetical protein
MKISPFFSGARVLGHRVLLVVKIVQSVYKRTYIKSPVELCGSIFFLAELCQAVEAGKLDVK